MQNFHADIFILFLLFFHLLLLHLSTSGYNKNNSSKVEKHEPLSWPVRKSATDEKENNHQRNATDERRAIKFRCPPVCAISLSQKFEQPATTRTSHAVWRTERRRYDNTRLGLFIVSAFPFVRTEMGPERVLEEAHFILRTRGVEFTKAELNIGEVFFSKLFCLKRRRNEKRLKISLIQLHRSLEVIDTAMNKFYFKQNKTKQAKICSSHADFSLTNYELLRTVTLMLRRKRK